MILLVCLKMNREIAKDPLINLLRIFLPSHSWSKGLTRTQKVESSKTEIFSKTSKPFLQIFTQWSEVHINIKLHINIWWNFVHPQKYIFTFKAHYSLFILFVRFLKWDSAIKDFQYLFFTFCSQRFIEVVPSILVVIFLYFWEYLWRKPRSYQSLFKKSHSHLGLAKKSLANFML